MKRTTLPSRRDEIRPDTPLHLQTWQPRSLARCQCTRATRCDALNRPLRRAADPASGIVAEEAAMYVGISASKFDELVRDRRMPARSASMAGRCGIFAN